MAVGRVAVQARLAHGCRSQSVEGWRADVVVALEEGLAFVEGFQQSHLFDSGCLVFVAAGGDVVGRAEFPAGIPFLGEEIPYILADVVGFYLTSCTEVVVVVMAGDKPYGCQSHEEEQGNFFH